VAAFFFHKKQHQPGKPAWRRSFEVHSLQLVIRRQDSYRLVICLPMAANDGDVAALDDHFPITLHFNVFLYSRVTS
jgi:hypothetical protein